MSWAMPTQAYVPPSSLREGLGVGQSVASNVALEPTHPPLTPPASGRGTLVAIG